MIRSFTNRFFFAAKKTQLYDLHVKNGGKMVEFAGYLMPVQYPTGIIKEHMQCREQAALFDVSHMGQLYITGPDRVKLLQRVTVGNTVRRNIGSITESYLTLFLNEQAGIIDDAIATNITNQDLVRIVVNAGNKYIVTDHINKVVEKEKLDVKIHLDESLALVALQGPEAVNALQKLTQFDLSQVPFMGLFKAKFADGKEYLVSRSGYTGEDGFEISGGAEDIISVTEALLNDPRVKLAGLGARDSLRIEAGLCLHGHEMSQTISPFEAGLMWTVYKRQQTSEREKFIGQDVLKKIVQDNKSGARKDRKRVGFQLNGAGIIRENLPVFDSQGQEIGKTSSGGYGSVLKKCVGMAYVDPQYTKSGTKLEAEQREKRHPFTIVKMPVVPSRYYKGWNDFTN